MSFAEMKLNSGKGVKVVIIDSGIKCNHKILQGKKLEGYSILNGIVCNGGYDDNIGHGTAVYSLISNIVPEAEFIIFRIFDTDFFCTQKILEITLEYIYNNIWCDVINISSGINVLESESLYNLCYKISTKGTIILSAFDNSGAVSFPAAFDCVIGVDSSENCKTVEEFEFVEDSIINLRAKAGMHRVAWKEPNYIFVEGTSFSVAYATAMTIKLIESGCHGLNNILNKFKENSIDIFTYKNLNKKNDFSFFQIDKAVIFPYSKEVDSLIRFQDILKFDIFEICDYKFSGKVGMNVSNKSQFANFNIEEFIIKDVEKLDWGDLFDTVILGYTDRISNIIKKDYKEEIFKLCIKYNKNLYMFDYNDKYNKYVEDMRAKGLKVYYPFVSQYDIPHNRFGKMYRISKPVLGIFGTSSHQGKYTLQLSLLKSLSHEYKISLIGTEPTAPLFGMSYCFPMGYHSTVYTNSYDSIYILNDMMHQLSKADTELIIVSSQYATIPFDVANISMFTNNQYDFLMGTQPEAIVLTINPFDELDYVIRTIKFLESAIEARVISIVVYPVDFTNEWTEFYGKRKPLTKEKFLKIKNKYESMLNIPVLSLNDNIDILKDIVLNYFS